MGEPLNEEVVKSLPLPSHGNRVHYFPDAIVQGSQVPRGFGVRCTKAGVKSFVLNYRLRGCEHRFTIGRWPDWSCVAAVREARELRRRVDRGENPLDDRAPEPTSKTISHILDDFFGRYVRKNLRSAAAIESAFARLVKPHIGKIGIYDLRRSHVAKMLDAIEDASGPVMADRTRAYLRKALSWYAERDDQFNHNAAFVKVEPRANPKERARTRVLSDAEIRVLWPLLDHAGTFGALVKVLLLTAQRRDEVARMSRQEIGPDKVWVIPAARYKTKIPNAVPLSKAALAVIEMQPTMDGSDYIFASRLGTPFTAFGKNKAALDRAMLAELRDRGGDKAELPNWTLHDLRRTAKTLMTRAGVRPDVSERVLGHVIGGVEGTYDRHSYEVEKRDALEKLATVILNISLNG
jgi:integrase